MSSSPTEFPTLSYTTGRSPPRHASVKENQMSASDLALASSARAGADGRSPGRRPPGSDPDPPAAGRGAVPNADHGRLVRVFEAAEQVLLPCKISNFFAKNANSWRVRSRLYRNRISQVNMSLESQR